MGAQVSQVDLQADEIDELALEFSSERTRLPARPVHGPNSTGAAPVTHKEVRRLYKRFRKLDREHRGAISKDELMAIPGERSAPLERDLCDRRARAQNSR